MKLEPLFREILAENAQETKRRLAQPYKLPVDHSTTAQTTTNENGGTQSLIPVSYELLPPIALTLVGQVLRHGYQKYGAWNWRLLPSIDNVQHVIGHSLAAISGDDQEKLIEGSPYLNHLAKAATRALFALEAAYLEEQETSIDGKLSPAIDRRGSTTPPVGHSGNNTGEARDRSYHSGVTASVGSMGSTSFSRRFDGRTDR